MDNQFDLVTHLVAGIAEAVSDRAGEPHERRLTRARTTAELVNAFQPRDAVEAMLIGHCVMLHEMIVESVHATMRGEDTPRRHTARGNIVALDKAFGNNLTRLREYREAPEVQPATETEIADRVLRHQTEATPMALNRQARRAMARKGIANVMPTRTAPAATASATGVS